MRPSEVTIPDEEYAAISNLKNRLAIVDGFLGPLLCKRLLDVGCKTGVMGEYFKRTKSCIVYGIDCDALALQAATKKGVLPSLLDIEKQDFPFPSGFFDAVIFSEVIEHLTEYHRVIMNIHRVLTDDGILVVSTPNLNSLPNMLKILRGDDVLPIYKPNCMDKHMRLFSAKSLKQLLTMHGFRIIMVDYVNYPSKTLKGTGYDLLCRMLPRWKEMIVTKARKGLRFPFFLSQT